MAVLAGWLLQALTVGFLAAENAAVPGVGVVLVLVLLLASALALYLLQPVRDDFESVSGAS